MQLAGKVFIESDKIKFRPRVYPTDMLKTRGFRWSKEEGIWSAPLSVKTYNVIISTWDHLEISPSVIDWLNSLTAVIPEEIQGNDAAFQFQKEGSAFLLRHKRALLSFAPGLGKTATAILAATQIEGYILVVAPLTLLHSWVREIKNWSGEEATIWHGPPSTWSRPSGRWIVTNYATVRIHMQTGSEKINTISTLIVDESLIVKNRKSKTAKAIKSISSLIPYVWLLSGSPISKFLDDLWMQLNILKPNLFRSYWRFANEYCQIDRGYWGTKIVGNKPDAFEKLKKDLADVFLARSQNQALNLPEWIFEDIPVPMGAVQYKAYREMEDTFLTHLPEGDELLAPSVLAQLTRLMQIASNTSILGGADHGAKWKALKGLLEFVRLPAIIWTTYKATASGVADLLSNKYKLEVLTGDTPQNRRHRIVDQFQSGDLDIIITNPGIGKYGLTLTAAKTSIYLERSYDGDGYYQSLHRVRRIGTTESPHVIHLIATTPEGGKTVDGVIGQILKFRMESTVQLTTGFLRNNWRT